METKNKLSRSKVDNGSGESLDTTLIYTHEAQIIDNVYTENQDQNFQESEIIISSETSEDEILQFNRLYTSLDNLVKQYERQELKRQQRKLKRRKIKDEKKNLERELELEFIRQSRLTKEEKKKELLVKKKN